MPTAETAYRFRHALKREAAHEVQPQVNVRAAEHREFMRQACAKAGLKPFAAP